MNVISNEYQSSITWFLSGVDGSVPSSEENVHLQRVLSKVSLLVDLLGEGAQGASADMVTKILRSALRISTIQNNDSSMAKFELKDLVPALTELVNALKRKPAPASERDKIDGEIREMFAELILLAKYSHRAEFADQVLRLVEECFAVSA